MQKQTFNFMNFRDRQNDIKKMKELVSVYSNSSFNSFLSEVMKVPSYSNKHEDIFSKNYKRYYLFLFHVWIKYVLSISDSLFLKLQKRHKPDKDFLELQKYLSSIGDVNSMADVHRVLNPNSLRLRYLISKYGFRDEITSGYHYISSDVISCGIKPSFPAEMFFAVSVKKYDIFQFIEIFQKKCMKEKLPYSFQFEMFYPRKDNIIIYTNCSHYHSYLNILNSMRKDYPNLISRCEDPSLLTNKVNSFVGSGVVMGNCQHYYSTKSKQIETSIEAVFLSFFQNNYSKKMKGNSGSMKLIDYISGIITIHYLKQMGISQSNLKNSYSLLSRKIKEEILKQLKNGKEFSFQDITFTDSSHLRYTIPKKWIERTIRENIVVVYDSFPQLYQQLKELLDIENGYCKDNLSNKVSFSYKKRR